MFASRTTVPKNTKRDVEFISRKIAQTSQFFDSDPVSFICFLDYREKVKF